MKKVPFPLFDVLIILCLGLFFYSGTYTIRNDRKQISENILLFINIGTVKSNSIDIKEELNIDNRRYVLFVINNSLGMAELIKGLNNRYKIESTRHGSGFFHHEIIKTNKGKYLILEGKNYNAKIAYIKALLDNKEYKIVIPKQEYFMVYSEVPVETQSKYLDLNNIEFYDSKDIDITDETFKVLLQ